MIHMIKLVSKLEEHGGQKIDALHHRHGESINIEIHDFSF